MSLQYLIFHTRTLFSMPPWPTPTRIQSRKIKMAAWFSMTSPPPRTEAQEQEEKGKEKNTQKEPANKNTQFFPAAEKLPGLPHETLLLSGWNSWPRVQATRVWRQASHLLRWFLNRLLLQVHVKAMRCCRIPPGDLQPWLRFGDQDPIDYWRYPRIDFPYGFKQPRQSFRKALP